MPRIGAIYARITEISYPMFRMDFTRHNNAYDSDDEENERQWSHGICFSHEGGLFLNEREIPYDQRERYTCKVFWKADSTTLFQMIDDTFEVRRARKEPTPPWSRSSLHRAAEDAWDRARSCF
jgi:hypothetical protein